MASSMIDYNLREEVMANDELAIAIVIAVAFQIYGAPMYAGNNGLMPNYGHSFTITGNPAWLPVLPSFGVPTLVNKPGNEPLAQNRFNTLSQRGLSILLLNFVRNS